MRRYSLSLILGFGLLLGTACSKIQPDQAAQNPTPPKAQAPAPAETMPDAAAPNDLPAAVTLNDGSKYRGVLVSKTGSQLTFRGENGATRTFDSRDVKSIRFGEPDAVGAPKAAAAAPAGSAAAPENEPRR